MPPVVAPTRHVRPVPISTPPSSSLYERFRHYFEVLPADTPELVDEVHALRYQVYCVEKPFEDADEFPDGREKDAYDRHSVHALIRHRASGLNAGALRLVLSDPLGAHNEFPIETHCGDHFYAGVSERVGAQPRTRIAEISRFAVSKEFRRRFAETESVTGLSPRVRYIDEAGQGARAFPQITLGLFAAVMRLSVTHDVTHWYAVMEPTLMRLVRPFGIHFPAIGPVVEYHGRRQPTFGSAADLLAGVEQARPDVWEVITDGGRFIP